jgi:hypothetical protein
MRLLQKKQAVGQRERAEPEKPQLDGRKKSRNPKAEGRNPGSWKEAPGKLKRQSFLSPRGMPHWPHFARTEVVSLTILDGPLMVVNEELILNLTVFASCQCCLHSGRMTAHGYA